MGLVTKSYTFSAGATIVAAEHNENFDTLYNLVNANIDNNNINASAAIAATKLNLATVAQSIAFSGTLDFSSATITAEFPASAVNIDGGDIDATNIGISTSADAIFASATIGTLLMSHAVTEISIDGTLGGNSDSAIPTEKAVKTYVDGSKTSIVTGDGNWTAPTGVTRIWVTAIGSGGSGAGGTSGSQGGGGGGAGELVVMHPYTVVAGNTYVCQVGVGGAQANYDNDGNDGEATIFDTGGGNYLSAAGGNKGLKSGSGGAAVSAKASTNLNGGDNAGAGAGTAGVLGYENGLFYPQGDGGAAASSGGGGGGGTVFGAGGAGGASSETGSAAAANTGAGGGGGGDIDGKGGAGGSGIIIIRY